MEFYLNTSNKGKLAEFQQLFSLHGISLRSTCLDLPEIAADPIKVLVHKASCLDDFSIVDDTSLEVEGTDIGINVRWLLNELANYLEKPAIWTVLLGYKKDGQIYVYEGHVNGRIVSPRGDGGFGFDPYFCPDGHSSTLAEAKPPEVNARALAVENFVKKKIYQIHQPIINWHGSWQEKK